LCSPSIEAVECYQRAIEIYTDMGRFSLAARYHSTVAEIYETELMEFEEVEGKLEFFFTCTLQL